MKHLFVPYDIAVKLKEKGFDEECMGIWQKPDFLHLGTSYWEGITMKKRVRAPMYQQAVDWLREKHNINIGITYYSNRDGRTWEYRIHYMDRYGTCGGYYETLTKAINESLSLL